MRRDAVMSDESRDSDTRPGFVRRYRLPLFLGLVALCLYLGSIAYIIYVRVPSG